MKREYRQRAWVSGSSIWKADCMHWGVCGAQSWILVRTQGGGLGGEYRAWKWSVRKDSEGWNIPEPADMVLGWLWSC
jgi:hypothetical protein